MTTPRAIDPYRWNEEGECFFCGATRPEHSPDCSFVNRPAEPGDEHDEPVDYDIEEAIRIAGLWRAGKMIGGDEAGVRDVLLAEIERLRAVKAEPRYIQ